jgi:hypothetical protein
MLDKLKEWRVGPIATLALAWIVCVGGALTTFFLAQARAAERYFEEMGFRLGASAAQFRVQWLDMWPRILGAYLIFVVLPPLLLWLLWRRAQREIPNPST